METVGEGHVETFAVTLESPGAKPDATSMRIVNLLDSVACLDRGASDFDEDGDGIWDIRHLRLREEEIPPDRRLFRLAEQSSVVIARKDLVEHFVAKNLQGVRFVTLENFSLAIRGPQR
jgi:hypothetical protein